MKKLFDHLNHIYAEQQPDYYDTLTEEERREYSPYMINRSISMVPEYLPLVNEYQMYYGSVGARESYLFFSNILPRRKVFAKYIKGAKDDKHEAWVVELLAKYFSVSRSEAVDYLDIMFMTDEGKADLRRICEMFAVDEKKIKKLKI